ncbi:MAG TPA: L,D-transpeptidase [Ktedonobacteraceae bacterium]
MQNQPQDFRLETVDEQIEHLLHTASSTPVSHVVQDLQGLYESGDAPEQVRRSLDTIWSRLSDRLSPEEQITASTPETGPLRALPRAKRELSGEQKQLFLEPIREQQGHQSGLAELEMNTLPARPLVRRSDKRNIRRTLAFSALAAIVLLSVFSWALIAHLNSQGGSNLGSGPGGTPAPTIPVTPAPKSLHDQAKQLLSQFHHEVTTWGQAHQYYDAYNGKSYELDYAYDQHGLGAILDSLVAQAQSSADYQQAIDQIQNGLANLHAMESNASDQTPWNQVHSSDSSLLHRYKLTAGTVVVVSLLEQSMRVYQNGQLARAFQVASGRYEEPSLPGSWQVIVRHSPTTLMSSYPTSSPYWYPPMQVKYALLYHTGGYLIYDSWWRTIYGAGSNFPHKPDPDSNLYRNDGNPGGISLPSNDMAWLYAHVQIDTPVVVY